MFKKNTIYIFLGCFILACSMFFSGITVKAEGLDGWIEANSNQYFYKNGSPVMNKWIQEPNGWCYLNSKNGAKLQEGWAQDSHGWCYIMQGYWIEHPLIAEDSLGQCIIGGDGYWTGERVKSVSNESSLNLDETSKDTSRLTSGTYIDEDTYLNRNKSGVWLNSITFKDGKFTNNNWLKDKMGDAGWQYLGIYTADKYGAEKYHVDVTGDGYYRPKYGPPVKELYKADVYMLSPNIIVYVDQFTGRRGVTYKIDWTKADDYYTD